MHLRVMGKRSKIRFIPVIAGNLRMIEEHLIEAGHRTDAEGALRPIRLGIIGRDVWTRPQEWLDYANVSTKRLYDRRKTKAEDSRSFRVKY